MNDQKKERNNSVPCQDAKTVDVLYPKPSSSSKQEHPPSKTEAFVHLYAQISDGTDLRRPGPNYICTYDDGAQPRSSKWSRHVRRRKKRGFRSNTSKHWRRMLGCCPVGSCGRFSFYRSCEFNEPRSVFNVWYVSRDLVDSLWRYSRLAQDFELSLGQMAEDSLVVRRVYRFIHSLPDCTRRMSLNSPVRPRKRATCCLAPFSEDVIWRAGGRWIFFQLYR